MGLRIITLFVRLQCISEARMWSGVYRVFATTWDAVSAMNVSAMSTILSSVDLLVTIARYKQLLFRFTFNLSVSQTI